MQRYLTLLKQTLTRIVKKLNKIGIYNLFQDKFSSTAEFSKITAKSVWIQRKKVKHDKNNLNIKPVSSFYYNYVGCYILTIVIISKVF